MNFTKSTIACMTVLIAPPPWFYKSQSRRHPCNSNARGLFPKSLNRRSRRFNSLCLHFACFNFHSIVKERENLSYLYLPQDLISVSYGNVLGQSNRATSKSFDNDYTKEIYIETDDFTQILISLNCRVVYDNIWNEPKKYKFSIYNIYIHTHTMIKILVDGKIQGMHYTLNTR